jgi:hypothetical protein
MHKKLVYPVPNELGSSVNPEFTEPITFYYSLYQQHPAPVPRIQKAKLVETILQGKFT